MFKNEECVREMHVTAAFLFAYKYCGCMLQLKHLYNKKAWEGRLSSEIKALQPHTFLQESEAMFS